MERIAIQHHGATIVFKGAALFELCLSQGGADADAFILRAYQSASRTPRFVLHHLDPARSVDQARILLRRETFEKTLERLVAEAYARGPEVELCGLLFDASTADVLEMAMAGGYSMLAQD